MSRVRTGLTAADWRDEGPQEHVSRNAKNTIGGSLVTEQPFGPSLAMPTPGDIAHNQRRRERRERNAEAAKRYRERIAS